MQLTIEQQQWIDALRSGNYKQCKEHLKTEDIDGQISYCCLGVATELFDPDAHELKLQLSKTGGGRRVSFDETASQKTVDELNLRSPVGSFSLDSPFYYQSLAYMNDQGATFEEIAAIIEENPQAVFNQVEE